MRRAIGVVIWLAASLAAAAALLEISIRLFDLGSEVREAGAAIEPEIELPDASTRAGEFGRELHPFRGWSRPPGDLAEVAGPRETIFGDEPISAWARSNAHVNRFGFQSHIEEYESLPRDGYVVGIFGGSVATNLANLVGDVLVAELEARFPQVAGRVVVANFSNGGYKQPQQAIALVEAIELGVPLDLVINVDGFNEARWGAYDARRGFHPLLPSRDHYTSTLSVSGLAPSPRELVLAGRAIEQRERARNLAAWRTTGLASRSELVQWVAGLAERASVRRAIATELELQREATTAPRRRQAAEVPIACPDRDPLCAVLVVDLWKRGSELMQALSDSIGADYVHVLQPNQYVPDSKPLTAQELGLMSGPHGPREEVVALYPLLVEQGAALSEAGIEFHDLTGVFRNHPETLYRDSCCHYDIVGNRILARAIVAALRDVAPR